MYKNTLRIYHQVGWFAFVWCFIAVLYDAGITHQYDKSDKTGSFEDGFSFDFDDNYSYGFFLNFIALMIMSFMTIASVFTFGRRYNALNEITDLQPYINTNFYVWNDGPFSTKAMYVVLEVIALFSTIPLLTNWYYLLIHREGFGKSSVYMLMIVPHILNLIFVVVMIGDTPTASALRKRQQVINNDNSEVTDTLVTIAKLRQIHQDQSRGSMKVYTENRLVGLVMIIFFMTIYMIFYPITYDAGISYFLIFDPVPDSDRDRGRNLYWVSTFIVFFYNLGFAVWIHSTGSRTFKHLYNKSNLANDPLAWPYYDFSWYIIYFVVFYLAEIVTFLCILYHTANRNDSTYDSLMCMAICQQILALFSVIRYFMKPFRLSDFQDQRVHPSKGETGDVPMSSCSNATSGTEDHPGVGTTSYYTYSNYD